jgi:glycosyltransferase involved in cell wall biosynthesis
MPQKVSVIIPTYQREQALRDTIPHVLNQAYSDFEIIIVCQGQKIDNLESDKIKVIYQQKPNLPLARNLGVKAAKGDIVLFWDDDITPVPDALYWHARSHREGADAVSGRVIDERNPGNRPDLVRFNPENGHYLQDFNSSREQESLSIPGCNFSVRRNIFKQLQFDSFFNLTAHWEEVDFAFRLRAQGGHILYQPRASLVHHLLPAGGCRQMPRWLYFYSQFRNSTLFYLKHCHLRHVRKFLISQKNLLEYQSRKPKGGHNLTLITSSFMGLSAGLAAYGMECLFFRNRLPKHRFRV